MLYLIGGVSRAGKSTLARCLCADHGVPWFSLDVLRAGLGKGAPQLGIDCANPDQEDASRLWPIVEEMTDALMDGRPYLIEGATLAPADVAGFAAARPGEVRACFLGYGGLGLEAKFRLVRDFTGPGDWTAGEPDEVIRAHIGYCIAQSRAFETQCSALGLAYFDTGTDFEAGLRRAETFLISRS